MPESVAVAAGLATVIVRELLPNASMPPRLMLLVATGPPNEMLPLTLIWFNGVTEAVPDISVVPSAMLKAPAPSAVALVLIMIAPLFKAMPPVKVFAPVRTKEPLPALINCPPLVPLTPPL